MTERPTNTIDQLLIAYPDVSVSKERLDFDIRVFWGDKKMTLF